MNYNLCSNVIWCSSLWSHPGNIFHFKFHPLWFIWQLHLLCNWNRLRPRPHICDFHWKIVCLKCEEREDTSYVHPTILLLYIILAYYCLQQQAPSKQQRAINHFQPLLSYNLISVCPSNTPSMLQTCSHNLSTGKNTALRGNLISLFQWKKMHDIAKHFQKKPIPKWSSISLTVHWNHS